MSGSTVNEHERYFKEKLYNALYDFPSDKFGTIEALTAINEIFTTINKNVIQQHKHAIEGQTMKTLLEKYENEILLHNQRDWLARLIDDICEVFSAIIGKSTYQEMIREMYKESGIEQQREIY